MECQHSHRPLPAAIFPGAVTSVTLSAGFLGQHLVQQLLDSGRYDVAVFDIRDAGISGVQTVVGDLRDAAQVEAAVSGRAHCIALPCVAPHWTAVPSHNQINHHNQSDKLIIAG